MQSLKNKNALITGAGKGIGKAVAIALAQEGVNVILVARTKADLEQTAAEAAAFGVKTLVLTADIADINSVNEAVTSATAEFKTIDILINNAGIGKFGKFLDLTPEEFENIIKINLFGIYYATRAVLPGMIEQQSGDIVNISSTAGLKGAALKVLTVLLNLL